MSVGTHRQNNIKGPQNGFDATDHFRYHEPAFERTPLQQSLDCNSSHKYDVSTRLYWFGASQKTPGKINAGCMALFTLNARETSGRRLFAYTYTMLSKHGRQY